jgi:hypothetical protein
MFRSFFESLGMVFLMFEARIKPYMTRLAERIVFMAQAGDQVGLSTPIRKLAPLNAQAPTRDGNRRLYV